VFIISDHLRDLNSENITAVEASHTISSQELWRLAFLLRPSSLVDQLASLVLKVEESLHGEVSNPSEWRKELIRAKWSSEYAEISPSIKTQLSREWPQKLAGEIPTHHIASPREVEISAETELGGTGTDPSSQPWFDLRSLNLEKEIYSPEAGKQLTYTALASKVVSSKQRASKRQKDGILWSYTGSGDDNSSYPLLLLRKEKTHLVLYILKSVKLNIVQMCLEAARAVRNRTRRTPHGDIQMKNLEMRYDGRITRLKARNGNTTPKWVSPDDPPWEIPNVDADKYAIGMLFTELTMLVDNTSSPLDVKINPDHLIDPEAQTTEVIARGERLKVHGASLEPAWSATSLVGDIIKRCLSSDPKERLDPRGAIRLLSKAFSKLLFKNSLSRVCSRVSRALPVWF